MKISPVQGTPTIPNPSSSGLSPDKLAAIKAMAQGQPKEEKETIQLGEQPNSNTQRIKMNVNRSHTLPIEPSDLQENAVPLAETPKVEPEVAVSDNSVQAQPSPEAIGAVSPELAQLAKDKRAFQLEKAEWEKAKTAPAQVPDGYIKVDDLKSNALSVLQKAGVTYEQLTNEILGQQSTPQLDLNQIKEDLLKTVEEKLAGKDSAQEESVYNFMRKEVDRMSNLNQYRLIRESGSQDDVMELVKRSWKERGEILDEKEAMDLIEAELREDAKRYAKLIGELEPTKAPAEQPLVQVTGQKTKTLTNKDSARPVMSRRQRAIAAALGQK